VAASDVTVPKGVLASPSQPLPSKAVLESLGSPVLAKPAFEGSSKGIRDASLLRDVGQIENWVRKIVRDYRQPVLIEEYVEGRELTVGVVGNGDPTVLGVMEVVPIKESDGPFVYSLEVKRNFAERVRYECPAKLTPSAQMAVERATLVCWRALGCRDVARFDFRLRGDEPVFLEVNPLPGLTPGISDLVLLAEKVGVGYAALIERILAAACTRLGLNH
jgi:D-alanine-D-alanine ligase